MIKSIFLGVLTSLFLQLILISVDYYFKGYITTPELQNFIAATTLSGISLGGAWYSYFQYKKDKNNN
jgi:hypothetical protein